MDMKSLFLSICIFISSQSLTAQNTHLKGGKTKYVYVTIRPGISLDHMGVKGYFKEPVKFNNPANFCIAGAADIDYDGEVIFRTELTYKPMHFHTEGSSGENKTFNTYELKGFSVLPEFQLLFKKPLNPKLNIYCGAGFGYRLSHVSKNELTYVGNPPPGSANSIQIEANEGVISCATGFIYCKHYEFNCKLSVTKWGISSLQKLSNRYVNMGVCYRL